MSSCSAPPGRTSALASGVVKPSGPHQAARCRASVNAAKTSSRGALRVRDITTSRGCVSVIGLLLGRGVLHVTQIRIKAIELGFPELAIGVHPAGRIAQRLRFDA